MPTYLLGQTITSVADYPVTRKTVLKTLLTIPGGEYMGGISEDHIRFVNVQTGKIYESELVTPNKEETP